MTHIGSDGSSFVTRIKRTGFKLQSGAENVAAGQKTVAGVVKAWMASPGHKRNILGKGFKFVGFGKVSDDRGTNYWTQKFSGLSDDDEECLERERTGSLHQSDVEPPKQKTIPPPKPKIIVVQAPQKVQESKEDEPNEEKPKEESNDEPKEELGSKEEKPKEESNDEPKGEEAKEDEPKEEKPKEESNEEPKEEASKKDEPKDNGPTNESSVPGQKAVATVPPNSSNPRGRVTVRRIVTKTSDGNTRIVTVRTSSGRPPVPAAQRRARPTTRAPVDTETHDETDTAAPPTPRRAPRRVIVTRKVYVTSSNGKTRLRTTRPSSPHTPTSSPSTPETAARADKNGPQTSSTPETREAAVRGFNGKARKAIAHHVKNLAINLNTAIDRPERHIKRIPSLQKAFQTMHRIIVPVVKHIKQVVEGSKRSEKDC